MNEHTAVGGATVTFVFRGHHSTVISFHSSTSFFENYSKMSFGLRRGVGFGSKSIASLVRHMGLFPFF